MAVFEERGVDMNTQAAIEKIEYIMLKNGSNNSVKNIQYSDSKYANQDTVEVLKNLFLAELKQAEEKLLNKVLQELQDLEIRTDEGGEYQSADTELMRTEAIGVVSELSENNDDFCACRESECPRKRHVRTEGEKCLCACHAIENFGFETKTCKHCLKVEHVLGEHGAVGYLTQDGRICTECGEKIVEDKKTE